MNLRQNLYLIQDPYKEIDNEQKKWVIYLIFDK